MLFIEQKYKLYKSETESKIENLTDKPCDSSLIRIAN